MAVQTDANTIKLSLEKDGSFAVKENRVLDAVFATILYVVFFCFLSATIANAANGFTDYWAPGMILLFALAFTYKVFSKSVYLLVNGNGIYINEKFITDWANFVSASYTQKQRGGEIEDNFVLVIYYYKSPRDYRVLTAPLGNTQNKSEEEVIEAIKYFYASWQQG